MALWVGVQRFVGRIPAKEDYGFADLQATSPAVNIVRLLLEGGASIDHSRPRSNQTDRFGGIRRFLQSVTVRHTNSGIVGISLNKIIRAVCTQN